MTMAGRLGYSEREFWSMSPRYFYNAAAGFVLGQREKMEVARYGWYYSILPYLKEGKREIEELVSFAWEAERLAEKKMQKIRALQGAWDKWMQEIEAKKNGVSTT